MLDLLVINKNNALSLIEEQDYRGERGYFSGIEQKFSLEENDKYFCVVVEYTTCSTFAPVSTEYYSIGCYKTKTEAIEIIKLIESKPNINKDSTYRQQYETKEEHNKKLYKELFGEDEYCYLPWVGHFEEFQCCHLLTWCKD